MAILEEQAQLAVHRFIGDALVFLVDGRADTDTRASPNGSGTLVRTNSGATLILTAKHVLEDNPPVGGFSLGGACLQGRPAISDVIDRHWSHPTEDVAVALLRDSAMNTVGTAALASALVAVSEDYEVRDDQPTLLCGYPTAYRRSTTDHARERINQYFVPVSYATDVTGPDARGRYVVDWDLGVMDDTKGRFRFLGIRSGEEYSMPHPGGMSGGGLWRVSGSVPPSEVWSPSKRTRLIGVASTYLEAREYAPSVRFWGDWFHRLVEEI